MKKKKTNTVNTTYIVIDLIDDIETNIPAINARLFVDKKEYAEYCMRNKFIRLFKLKHTRNDIFSKKYKTPSDIPNFSKLDIYFLNLVKNIEETLSRFNIPVLGYGKSYLTDFYSGANNQLKLIYDFVRSKYTPGQNIATRVDVLIL